MAVIAIAHRTQVRREPMLQHLREYSHIALKGHALVEEILEQIIAQHCRAASVLENVEINFYIKAKLARALVGDSRGPDLWSLVWRLYLIRSRVARTLKSRGVRQSIGEFIHLESQWTKNTMPTISTFGVQFRGVNRTCFGHSHCHRERGVLKSLTGNEARKQTV